MNKYSYVLVLLAFAFFILSEFVNEIFAYVGFGTLLFAFTLPMIVTKATGKEFKGN